MGHQVTRRHFIPSDSHVPPWDEVPLPVPFHSLRFPLAPWKSRLWQAPTAYTNSPPAKKHHLPVRACPSQVEGGSAVFPREWMGVCFHQTWAAGGHAHALALSTGQAAHMLRAQHCTQTVTILFLLPLPCPASLPGTLWRRPLPLGRPLPCHPAASVISMAR